jgi:hypothetical protein
MDVTVNQKNKNGQTGKGLIDIPAYSYIPLYDTAGKDMQLIISEQLFSDYVRAMWSNLTYVQNNS